MLKQEREKYERKLELVREMNRMLRRDIDSLDDQGGIIDTLRAELEDMKQKAATREADIKDLEEERDEWKQAYEKVIGDPDSWHWRNQPVAKRISELCGKVTLQSVQITDLTIERDSYKSMYQSSQDINAGLTKEHNELKAVYEKLACSQPTPAEHLTSQMSKLISSMNEAGAAAVKPAPGRLEIAAIFYAADIAAGNINTAVDPDTCPADALDHADALIAAAKELK